VDGGLEEEEAEAAHLLDGGDAGAPQAGQLGFDDGLHGRDGVVLKRAFSCAAEIVSLGVSWLPPVRLELTGVHGCPEQQALDIQIAL
jgi:hypothetical protein